MKFLKLAALAAIVSVAALDAQAAPQSWQHDTAGTFRLSRSQSISSTSPVPVVSVDASRQTVVWISSTNPVTVNVNRTLSNGAVLDTRAVNVTSTPVSVTYPAPQSHQALVISRTTILSGTDVLYQNVVQSR